MTLKEAKEKFSLLYLGQNGIHAVGINKRSQAIRVLSDRVDALNGIPNPFEGYRLDLEIRPAALPL